MRCWVKNYCMKTMLRGNPVGGSRFWTFPSACENIISPDWSPSLHNRLNSSGRSQAFQMTLAGCGGDCAVCRPRPSAKTATNAMNAHRNNYCKSTFCFLRNNIVKKQFNEKLIAQNLSILEPSCI